MHKLKPMNSSQHYDEGNATILCLLFLAMLLLSGCPVADPYTESRIVNNTANAIQVELLLDKNKYGLEQSDTATAYAREWLEEFSTGEGVEILAIDTAGLSARYRIAPAGFMIAHASLGTEPYFYFKKLVIRQDNKTLIFNNEQEITQQFRLKEDAYYQYEFQITDAVFSDSDSDSGYSESADSQTNPRPASGSRVDGAALAPPVISWRHRG